MPGLLPEDPRPARAPRQPRRTPSHSEPQPGTGEQRVDLGRPLEPVADEYGDLDAIDLASLLSFPASDPPALSGPA